MHEDEANESDGEEDAAWALMGREFQCLAGKTVVEISAILDEKSLEFWGRFLALGCQYLNTDANDSFRRLLNDLSEQAIESLPDHLQAGWKQFHRDYMDLVGGTRESLLFGLNQGWREDQLRLIEEYSPLIESQIRKYFSTDLVEDVKQEVLFEVFKEMKRRLFRRKRRGSFRSWLSKTCRNVAIKFLKKERKYRNLSDLGLDHLADQLENPNSKESYEWKKAICKVALDRLKEFLKTTGGRRKNAERDLEIFLAYTLRNVEGERATAVDVARMFDVSPQTVFNVEFRMQALLQRFREELGDDLEID